MLFKVIVWLSCVVAFFANSDENGGPKLRIIGGKEAKTRYKFVVSLEMYLEQYFLGIGTGLYEYTHICGASIIRPDCIVTAAHCVYGNNTANEFSVFAGTNNLDDPSGERFFVRSITVHPSYVAQNDSDIAILRLNSSMVFSDRIGSIAQSTIFVGGGVRLSCIGWGSTTWVSLISPRKLQEMNTTSITDAKCNNNPLYKPTKTDICTQQTGHGTYYGDSGGPLFLVRDNETVLVGVVSSGFLVGGLFTDIYTRASYFYDFIQQECDKP